MSQRHTAAAVVAKQNDPAAIWDCLGRQFRNPAGLVGRLMGRFMRLINHRPNLLAIAALQIEPADRILELGFGPGDAIAIMTRLAPRGVIWGIDRSSTMLAQATRRNATHVNAGSVRLSIGEFSELPLPSASIDKILAVNVVYFWDDAPGILKEVRRVLKPGGTLALYATDKTSMRNWKFASLKTHKLFGASDLVQMLQSGGFNAAAIKVDVVLAGPGVTGLVAVARND